MKKIIHIAGMDSYGLALMQNYPENVPDLIEEGGYRDLREFTLFKEKK